MVSVGSVSVDVLPNAKGWVAKLRSQLLPEANALGLEIGRTLSARINEALGNAHLTVDVDTAAADAQLAVTEELVNRLDGRRINVNVDADTGGATANLAAFGALAGSKGSRVGGLFSGIAHSMASSAASMIPLLAGVAVLATALVPIVATAAGLAAALVLPLAAAGGGLTLFGLLAGKQIANTNKVAKQIDELKKKAATLVDPKARAAAAAQAKALEASLTGPQKAFLKAKQSLSAAFRTLTTTGKGGDALFAPIVAGMNLLAKIMPALSPVIQSVSKAITGLLDGLAKSASGKGFTSFIDGFAKLAGATITTAGKQIGLFGKGLFNIFKEFLPLSKSVGGGLTSLGQRFLDFSQKASTKKGIQSFIDYVKANGPAVLHMFGSIGKAFVNFAINAAPAGAKLIRVVDAIFTAYNKFLVGIRPLLKAIGPMFAAMGHAILSVYNTVIGPVMSLILTGFGKLMVVAGKALSLLGHAPGFGWAKKLGKDLQDAGHAAQDLGDQVKKITIPKTDPKGIKQLTIASHGAAAVINKLSTGPTIRPKTDTKGLTALQTAAGNVVKSFGKIFGGKTTGGSVKVKVDAGQVTTATAKAATLSKGLSKVNSSNTKLKINKTSADQAAAAVNKIVSALGKVQSKKITVTVAYKAGPKPAGIATGGYVRGPGTGTSDSIPAMISNGEFVVNAAATKRNLALLHSINAQRYANGGVAGSPATASAGSSGPLLVRVTNMGTDYIDMRADDRIDAAQGFAQTIGGMSR